MGKVVIVLVLAVAVVGAAFSPASPVSIDVERRHLAADVKSDIALGSARLELQPTTSTDAMIRRDRKMPWERGLLGDVYEFRTTPDVVTTEHPATVTLPLPKPLTPNSETLVTFRDSRGWAAHPAVVGPEGTTATAVVPHLSRWAGLDMAFFASSLGRILDVGGIRTPKPACDPAPGVVDAAPDSDPMAWVCVSDAGDGARNVLVTANRGFPSVLRVEGPITMTRPPASGGLVEEIAEPIYAASNLVILPPGTNAEFRWNGAADGSIRLESEIVTVFIRALLTLLTSARATAAELAGAVISAVDCLLTAPRSLTDAWQPCLGAMAGVTNMADLRHSGIRIAGEALGKLLKLLGLAGLLDLLVEKVHRDGDPVITHLRAPVRRAPGLIPVPAPGARGSTIQTGSGSTAGGLANVSVHGCH